MWQPPNALNVFLNMDGSSSNNSLAIGGALQNLRGDVLETVLGLVGMGSPI